MNLLLWSFSVVLLGSCIALPSCGEEALQSEYELDVDENYIDADDVDAVPQDVEDVDEVPQYVEDVDDSPAEAHTKVEWKRAIPYQGKDNTASLQTKKSPTSDQATADNCECEKNSAALTDIDKERLLVEVLKARPNHDGLLVENLPPSANNTETVAAREAVTPDVANQMLRIEVQNAGTKHNSLPGDQLLTFENKREPVVSGQAACPAGSDDADHAANQVNVLRVDAGGTDLVNEKVCFENNMPRAVEVETEDRILVHDLGTPSSVTVDETRESASNKPRVFIMEQKMNEPNQNNGSGQMTCHQQSNQQAKSSVESQPAHGGELHWLKVSHGNNQQQLVGQNNQSEDDDMKPSNTRPLNLENSKNQPLELLKSIRANGGVVVKPEEPGSMCPHGVCSQPTEGDHHPAALTETQLQLQNDQPSMETSRTASPSVKNPPALNMPPPAPPINSIASTPINLMQYRLGPWAVLGPLRLSDSNSPGPKNNLPPPFLQQNLVLLPEVPSSNPSTDSRSTPRRNLVGGASDKRGGSEPMAVVVVQPEVVPVRLAGGRPLLLIPEGYAVDQLQRGYVMVPSDQLPVVGHEASASQKERVPSQQELAVDKFAPVKSERLPADLVNKNKPVNENPVKNRLGQPVGKPFHDLETGRDNLNVERGYEAGPEGNCCGPNCHCTCNMGLEGRAGTSLVGVTAGNRRHFESDRKAIRPVLSHSVPTGHAQERRWLSNKLAKFVTKSAKKPVQSDLRDQAEDSTYRRRTETGMGVHPQPGRLSAMGRLGSDPRRMASMGVRPVPAVPEIDSWDVYREIFGSRCKRRGDRRTA